tara:strand:- start:104 stop:478 length:375 start_codon:yes stop_codon:yes gene_type:complete
MDNNTALLERLEKVIDSLSENSIKMGQMLAVHDEKLEKQDRIDAVLFEKIKQVDEKLDKHANDIKKGCERDIKLVDNRLRTIEKKMWSIFGALSIISFLVSPIGQRIIRPMLTPAPVSSIIIEK